MMTADTLSGGDDASHRRNSGDVHGERGNDQGQPPQGDQGLGDKIGGLFGGDTTDDTQPTHEDEDPEEPAEEIRKSGRRPKKL